MSEPTKKKRRSKWGITPEEMMASTSTTTTTTTTTTSSGHQPQGPKAAEAAAAKINAMLAAQGKLAKSEPPPYRSVLQSAQSSILATPLFPSGSGLLSTPLNTSLLPNMGGPNSHHSGPYYVQDKVFIGLANVPSTFNCREKLEGPNVSYLSHIATQTGAKVFLRGQGSGYFEPTSKRESFEALHIYVSHSSQKGLESARKLCESLIQTVQKECDNFVASQQGHAPLGFGGTGVYRSQVPYVNPYQYPASPGGFRPPPPMGPGYGAPPNYHGPPQPGPGHGYGGPFLPHPHPGNAPPGYLPGPPPPPPAPDPISQAGHPLPVLQPPQPHGYYVSAPPPSRAAPPPSRAAPPPPPPPRTFLQQQPPLDVVRPDAFSVFKPHDREPEPIKRKFTEMTTAVTTSTGTSTSRAASKSPHLSINKNTGKESQLLPNEDDPVNYQDSTTKENEMPGMKLSSGATRPKDLSAAGSGNDSEKVVQSDSGSSTESREAPALNCNGGTNDGNGTAVGKWQSLSVSSVPGNEPLPKDHLTTKEGHVTTSEDDMAKEDVPLKKDIHPNPKASQLHASASQELDSILMPPPPLPHGLKKRNRATKKGVVAPADEATPPAVNNTAALKSRSSLDVGTSSLSSPPLSSPPPSSPPPPSIGKETTLLKSGFVNKKHVSLVSYGSEDSDSDIDS